LFSVTKIIKAKLRNLLSEQEYSELIKKVNAVTCKKREKKLKVMSKKLKHLISTQKEAYKPPGEIHDFYPRVVNLTNVKFDNDENEMLGKWGKYNPFTNNNVTANIKNLIMETETAISYIDKSKQDKIRYEAADKIGKIISKSKLRRLRKKQKVSNDKTIITSIKNKISNNNARVVEADKSNATVVMLEPDLDHKVDEYCKKSGVHEGMDRTHEYNKAIKSLIKNSSIIPPQTKHHLFNSKAGPPQFKPLVKTHKDGLPVRPVINSVDAPSYKLSKFISNLLKNRLSLDSEYACKNSKEFIEKIKKLEVKPQNIFITCDIDNMYANIPRAEAVEALIEKAKASNNFTESELNELKCMLDEITKQNYFEWKGKIFYDSKGLPMGGPLSALLAEVYLQKFVKEHIMCQTNPHRQKILFFCRYVDDCFLSIRATKRQAGVILNHLNKLHPSIKFKMEVEENNVINFLDVKVIKAGNCLEFGIYRKPTQTDLVIPFQSNHPFQYKMAAFRSMVYRLLTYQLSSSEYDKEVKVIKHIAYVNGYDHTIVDNLIRKTRYKMLRGDKNDQDDKKYIPINYCGNNTQIIGNILKKNSFHPGYKINKYISLNRPKTPTGKENSQGVYLIECNGGDACGKKYVGYTKRTFKERFREHNASNQANPTSKVAQHLKQYKTHSINFDDSLTVLRNCKSQKEAQTWEEYYIYDHVLKYGKDGMLNKQDEFADKITYRLYNSLN